MNQQEVSFRSDEQAQSQDRERLQSEIQEAWDRLMYELDEQSVGFRHSDGISLLRWYLGVK